MTQSSCTLFNCPSCEDDAFLTPVHHGDAVEWLRSLPKESVDLVITDPPYASLEKHRAIGTTTRLTKKWFPVVQNDYYPLLMPELFRVMKKHTHLYIFSDDETSDVLVADGKAAGFKYWKRIVWDKVNMGMGYHYRNRHEFILFFEKGKRKLRDATNVESILSYKSIRRPQYPTEKPVELCEFLVGQSSEVGEVVCDPFVGSGAIAVAARNKRRGILVCDINDEAVKVTKERLGL